MATDSTPAGNPADGPGQAGPDAQHIVPVETDDGSTDFVAVDGCRSWPLKTSLFGLTSRDGKEWSLYHPDPLIPPGSVDFRVILKTADSRYILVGAPDWCWEVTEIPQEIGLRMLLNEPARHHEIARIPPEKLIYYEIKRDEAWVLITRSGYRGDDLPDDLRRHLATRPAAGSNPEGATPPPDVAAETPGQKMAVEPGPTPRTVTADSRDALRHALGLFSALLRRIPSPDLHAVIVEAPGLGIDPGTDLPPLPINLRSKTRLGAFLIPLNPAVRVHYFGDAKRLEEFRDLSRVALAALRRAFPDLDDLARRVFYIGTPMDADHILGDLSLLMLRNAVIPSPERRYAFNRWFWTRNVANLRIPYYEDERRALMWPGPAPPEAANAPDVTTFTGDVFSFSATALDFAIGSLPEPTLFGPSATSGAPKGDSRAVGPIAAYLAERSAILARRREENERSRLADLAAIANGAEPDHSQALVSRQRHEADLEACETRHFGRLDPRTGAALDTPARLWRWIVDRIDLYRSDAAKTMQQAGWGNATAFRDTLVETYGKLLELNLPGAIPPPYPPMSEREARDMLQWIANGIQALEANPDRPHQREGPRVPPNVAPETEARSDAPADAPPAPRPPVVPDDLDSRAVGFAHEMIVKGNGINVSKVARLLGCERTKLYDQPGFMALVNQDRTAREAARSRRPRGTKDRYTRSVEAWREDD